MQKIVDFQYKSTSANKTFAIFNRKFEIKRLRNRINYCIKVWV